MPKLLSIVIPCFNEAENLPALYDRLAKVMSPLSADFEAEFLFVNDASTDGTAKILSDLSAKDNRVKFLEFSRNFGKEVALTAGINYAKGDAVLMIDADLQHPPEFIPEFLKKWENGADVVVGVRESNKGEGVVKKIGSIVFYKIMNSIGDTKMVSGATDFRLVDKKVAEEFKRFSEHGRITRGLIDWLGFKREYVYFNAELRKFGKPRYGFFKLLHLALYSFISHSLLPLQLAGYLGVAITTISGILCVFIFVEKYLLNDIWNLGFSSPAILAVINLFLIGIVLSCLGLIALYIANIHAEVMNRPMYVIRNKKI